MEKEKIHQGYRNFTPTFKKLWEAYSEKELPEEVISAWETLSLTMRMADSYLDNTSDLYKKEEIVANVFDSFSGNGFFDTGDNGLDEYLDSLNRTLESLPKRNKSNFLSGLRRLLEVAEDVRSTETIDELAFLTRLEGQLTSRLFYALIPENSAEREKQGEYWKLISRFGRTANVFDNIIDFDNDFNNCEIKIEPSLENRIKLFQHMAGDSIYIMRNLRPKHYREVVTGIINAVKRR